MSWLAVTLVLVTVLLTNRLARFLADAASGEIAGDVVFTLLGLKALGYLGLVLPASFFLGLVLAFGRLYRDNEMAAMIACGAGPRTFYRSLFLLAVPLAVLVGYISLFVGPWANALGEQIEAEASQSVGFAGLRPGRFMTSDDGDGMFYIQGMSEGQRLEGVVIQAERDEGLTLVSAARARQQVDTETGERFLVLYDGVRYDGVPGEFGWRMMRFEEHGVRLPERGSAAVARIRSDAMPTEALLAAGRAEDWAELQWRVSMPIMTLLLTFMALPLSRSAPREGRYGKLLAAVLIYVAYSNFLSVSMEWMGDGALSPLIGLWWVHLAVAAGAAALLMRHHGVRRRRRA